MKISKLIAALEKVLAKIGDRDLVAIPAGSDDAPFELGVFVEIGFAVDDGENNPNAPVALFVRDIDPACTGEPDYDADFVDYPFEVSFPDPAE